MFHISCLRGKKKRMMSSIFAIVIFCLFSCVSSLYFHIGETERKCFIEDIPDETIVVGTYRVEIFDREKNVFIASPPGLGMHVEVKEPEGKIILSRTYATEGRFTFSSATAGEHNVCLYANSSAWFGGGMLRVHLTIAVGEQANDYQVIASRDKLSEIEIRVRQLLDQVEQIGKEQNYQRNREEKFREMSESTNQRVLWWSVCQSLLLLCIGFWQMQHLRGFFEAKKLV